MSAGLKAATIAVLELPPIMNRQDFRWNYRAQSRY